MTGTSVIGGHRYPNFQRPKTPFALAFAQPEKRQLNLFKLIDLFRLQKVGASAFSFDIYISLK